MQKAITFSLILLIGCTACQTNKVFKPDFSAGPPTIVYKTTSNFDQLVPVQVSNDQLSILSFPHPEDLKQAGQLSLPVKLNKGYLLDQRGIDLNTRFLNINYSTYAARKKPMETDSLILYLIKENPFLEIYNCGNRHQYTNIRLEINALILNGTLEKSCKKLF